MLILTLTNTRLQCCTGLFGTFWYYLCDTRGWPLQVTICLHTSLQVYIWMVGKFLYYLRNIQIWLLWVTIVLDFQMNISQYYLMFKIIFIQLWVIQHPTIIYTYFKILLRYFKAKFRSLSFLVCNSSIAAIPYATWK